MRRALVLLVPLGLAVAVAVGAIADRVQDRADVWVPGTSTLVRFDVDTYDAQKSDADSARALWWLCAEVIRQEVLDVEIGGDGQGAATVSPALGPHERTRLSGCIEDASIDSVQGELVSFEERPAP